MERRRLTGCYTLAFAAPNFYLNPPAIPGQPLTLLQRADVNRDRTISALDALLTINYLNRQQQSNELVDESGDAQRLDVSGDGDVTAMDALLIINLMNRSEAEGEVYPLTPGADWLRESQSGLRDEEGDVESAVSPSLF